MKLPLRAKASPVYFPNKRRLVAEIQPDLRGQIKQLCDGNAPWPLFLSGRPGVGKTCAALCILDHTSGFYWTVSRLCDELIRAGKGELHSRETGRRIHAAQIWEEMATAKVVVLDELGARERVSDFQYDTIKRVLDDREGLPLVCVSNLPLAQLVSVYDDRIGSRLAAGTVAILHGQDRRLGDSHER